MSSNLQSLRITKYECVASDRHGDSWIERLPCIHNLRLDLFSKACFDNQASSQGLAQQHSEVVPYVPMDSEDALTHLNDFLN